MSTPHYLKIHANAPERDLLRRACAASDGCSLTDFVLSSVRRRVRADLPTVDPALESGDAVQIQLVNPFTDAELADLRRCAAARRQSVSQYMALAALDDARQMTGV